MYPAVVDITTQIELEREFAVRRRCAALAGLDPRLRDILAAKYFLEHTPRELVAAIRRLAAVAGGRLEEPLLAGAPEFSACSGATMTVCGIPASSVAMVAGAKPSERRKSASVSSVRLRLSAYSACARGCGVTTAVLLR